MSERDAAKILVVDDLPEKLLVYQTVLEELGQPIVYARSGQEALREILRNEFAVILLDVNMPGMDGFETAALIRQRKQSAHTPIIFITAFADEMRAIEGYALGAVDYILAPIVPAVVRAKVKVFVELFRMTQQVRRQAEERVALSEERSKRAAAEDANRRLVFLARAGEILGQSLEYEATLRDVATLPIADLADEAVMAVLGPRDEDWDITIGREGGRLERFKGRHRMPEELGQAIATNAGANAVSVVGSATASFPLRARGRTFAILVLSRRPSGRTFAAADLAIAEAFASRAAVALDNAKLYQDVQKADRQKNEFLSMLAHELRNPLAPIRNAVELLRIGEEDRAGRQHAREIIERQVNHLVRLVDNLFDISRITRGKIRLQTGPVELNGVMALAVEAARPVIDSRGHELHLTWPAEPVWLNADAARIVQVFTNLLNNAAKYTEPGGQIWFVASVEAGEPVVRVRDTGVGIPANMLSAIFELFTQVDCALDRSQGGLGVGLTLVLRLVEMHGGSVRVHSDGPGHGSEFVVRLPRLKSTDSKTDADGSHDRESALRNGKHRRVMIVDDNVDAAASLAELLRMAGHEVRVTHTGPAAIGEAPQFAPELIILDLGLPGMDGFAVAEQLRAQPALQNTRLIALTGYGRAEDRRRALTAGFDHHLIKPIDLASLDRILTEK